MDTHLIEIVVRGHLAPELVVALEGYDVRPAPRRMTRIVGPVVDQARLFGLLEMFADLNIEVVSVNPVNNGENSPGAGDVPSPPAS